MKFSMLHRSALIPLLLVSFAAAPLVLAAQNDGTNGPPAILLINQDLIKPGMGAPYAKDQAEIAETLRQAKSPWHYVALNSISGPSQVLGLSGYGSLAEVAATHMAAFSNHAALTDKLDRLDATQGDTLASTDLSVWQLRDGISLNDQRSLKGVRYMRISFYQIRPGHRHEWDEAVTMVIAALKKSIPEANFATFREVYGSKGNSYIMITPLRSLKEEDARLDPKDKRLEEAMGVDELKKLSVLEASCIESEQTNLFYFNPKMSYAPDSWTKMDPDFWGPKTEAHARGTETHRAPATSSK